MSIHEHIIKTGVKPILIISLCICSIFIDSINLVYQKIEYLGIFLFFSIRTTVVENGPVSDKFA